MDGIPSLMGQMVKRMGFLALQKMKNGGAEEEREDENEKETEKERRTRELMEFDGRVFQEKIVPKFEKWKKQISHPETETLLGKEKCDKLIRGVNKVFFCVKNLINSFSCSLLIHLPTHLSLLSSIHLLTHPLF